MKMSINQEISSRFSAFSCQFDSESGHSEASATPGHRDTRGKPEVLILTELWNQMFWQLEVFP